VEDLASSISALSTCIDAEEPDEVTVKSDEKAAKRRLHTYQLRGKDDDTVRVLKACLKYMPSHGKRILVHLIKNDATDGKLFDLSEHLTTVILIPSKRPCNSYRL
jgi:hypothetical protein